MFDSLQASRNEYGNTLAMTATQPDCKEALSAVIIGGEPARLKMAEEIEAAAAEAEAAHLEQYMQKEERSAACKCRYSSAMCTWSLHSLHQASCCPNAKLRLGLSLGLSCDLEHLI